MSGSDDTLHRVRSVLALIKLQLETGGYSPVELVGEVDEAIALLSNAELSGQQPAQPDPAAWPPVAVVVVDDEPRLADALARRLSREGLVARAVYSVVDVAYSTAAEVVILDLSAAACAEPTARRRLAAARPVVVTGASLSEAAPLLHELDPFAVLQKPFSTEQLASVVRQRAAGGIAER